jgi:hypothetical protein
MADAMLEAEHFKCSEAVLRLGEVQIDYPERHQHQKFMLFLLSGRNLRLWMAASCTFAPFSQKLSQSDTKFVARIRNTLILGLVGIEPC